MSTPPASSSAPRFDAWLWFEQGLRRLGTAEPWSALFFLLASFGLGVFWFVTLVTLLAVGGALAITWIGLPILAATLFLWVGGARFERWRIGLFSGRAIPAPYRPRPDGSMLRRARARAGEGAVWRDLLYLLLLFPLGVAELVIAAVSLALPLAFVTLPLYSWSVPGGVTVFGESATRNRPATGWVVDTFAESLLVAVIGLGLAAIGARLVIWTARGHAALGRRLLGPSGNAHLAARVETLTRSRSAVVEAQLAERQRIERDLHDGAQQRLVSLAMGLGLAKEKLRTDPEAARALVEESHEEAKRVLAELRDLVRGIHPAVLADRGLDAAISAVAARSPIPVRVDVQLDERPAEAVEAAAYFVVVEALANVAKHSGAREARVSVRREGEGMIDDRLVVDVVDDGGGGAVASNGTGLNGLRDRLAALDGRLSIDSRAGGPTWVLAEIPWTAAAAAPHETPSPLNPLSPSVPRGARERGSTGSSPEGWVPESRAGAAGTSEPGGILN